MGTAPRAAAALASICLLAASVPARAERLDVRRVTLDLPGPPAAVVPADLDADGRVDLAVVAAWSEIEEVGGVRVEDLVQVATVIPALFERREVRAYLAQDDGSYAHAATLPLPRSVLHLEAAGPLGAVALTDAGLSRLRYAGGALSLEPLIEAPPLLAGTETFYSALSIVHDLDGDGRPDVWFPAADGPQVRLGVDGPAGPALGPPRPVAAPAARRPRSSRASGCRRSFRSTATASRTWCFARRTASTSCSATATGRSGRSAPSRATATTAAPTCAGPASPRTAARGRPTSPRCATSTATDGRSWSSPSSSRAGTVCDRA